MHFNIIWEAEKLCDKSYFVFPFHTVLKKKKWYLITAKQKLFFTFPSQSWLGGPLENTVKNTAVWL